MNLKMETDYVIRALITLADKQKSVSARELAKFLSTGQVYISKVMRKLRDAKIIKAVHGKNGGYELARRPEEITVADIVAITEFRGHVAPEKALGKNKKLDHFYADLNFAVQEVQRNTRISDLV